jgi:hypothetical protein
MLGSLALVVLLAAAVVGMFAAFGALGRRQETLYPGLPQEDPPRCKSGRSSKRQPPSGKA